MSKLVASVVLTTVIGCALGGPAFAESPFSASVHLGTTGVGGELQFKINDYLAVRGDGDWLGYSRDFSSNDLRYSGRATWATFGAFADLHPFRNGLFVSGGAYFGDRKVTLTGTPQGNVVVSGVSLTPAQIGQLNGEGRLSSTAPFAGFGWDSTFRSKGGLGFKALLGVAFSDDPSISLGASGPAASLPIVQTYVQNYVAGEEAQVRHDARFLKTYPVAQVGLGYRF